MSKEKVPAWVRNLRAKQDNFWQNVYPEFTLSDKLHFWADDILSMIRVQGETTGDEYSGFSPSWYKQNKKHEPAFDSILKKVLSSLKNEINGKELLRHIDENDSTKVVIKPIKEYAGAFPVRMSASVVAEPESPYEKKSAALRKAAKKKK